MKNRKLFIVIMPLFVLMYGFKVSSVGYIPEASFKVEGSHCFNVYDETGSYVKYPEETSSDTYTVDLWLYGAGHTTTEKPVERKSEVRFELKELFRPEKVLRLSVILPATRKEIDLIQPRHIYAPISGFGDVYMPTSLMTAGSQLIQAGYKVKLWDENISEYHVNASIVGVNLVGAPYVPIAQSLLKKVDAKYKIVGGQVINGFTNRQLSKLFPGVLNGNQLEGLVSPYRTSLIPMYEQISDEVMKMYLENEFSLFVSQGCKHNCNFCGAVRTQEYAVSREVKVVAEMYRDVQVIGKDLGYLFSRAEKLGVTNLKMYVSNLDIFQSPFQLSRFVGVMEGVQTSSSVAVELHGLATVNSFLKCMRKHPEVIERLRSVGYVATGFGIDGFTPAVWKAIKKTHNYSSKEKDMAHKSIEALRISQEEFDITPEVLMVFGHRDVDTDYSMHKAVEFTRAMVDSYGAVPRPHVSKNLIPGNDHWSNPKNIREVERFIQHPWLFQALDFCALATPYTHGNQKFADMVNEHYLAMCNIPGNVTRPIYPISFDGYQVSDSDVEQMFVLNEGRFDR